MQLIWILLYDSFIFGFVYGIIIGIPELLKIIFIRLFKRNIIVMILHSLSGITGIILIFSLFIKHPPMLVGEEESAFLISGLWNIAPLKTIFIIIPFVFFVIGLFFSSIVAPVAIYFELKNEKNGEKSFMQNSKIINISKDAINKSNSTNHYSNNIHKNDQAFNTELSTGAPITKSLDRLYIPATYKDPLVDFNSNGQLWIKGRSIPEDASMFYGDLFEWIEKLCKNPPEKIVLNIQLTNHNDGASKYILQLLRVLKDSRVDIIINWYYEDWDDEIIFLGEALSSGVGIPFNFVVIDNA